MEGLKGHHATSQIKPFLKFLFSPSDHYITTFCYYYNQFSICLEKGHSSQREEQKTPGLQTLQKHQEQYFLISIVSGLQFFDHVSLKICWYETRGCFLFNYYFSKQTIPI